MHTKDTDMNWWGSKKRDIAFNAIWMVSTLLTLIVVHYIWPFHSWGWGLLIGAGVGGSTVLISAFVLTRSPLAGWFMEDIE